MDNAFLDLRQDTKEGNGAVVGGSVTVAFLVDGRDGGVSPFLGLVASTEKDVH